MSNSLDRSHKKSSTKNNSSVQNEWDAVIADARQRITDLKYSIKVFKERKQRGDKWRGVATQSPSA